jgi:predicted dithiol-disulfide oxidoreductase (DUF899 family)
MATTEVVRPRVVSEREWLEARQRLLAKEKELTRQRDLVSAERRRLPWVKVEKEYAFDTPEGRQTLEQLFGANSQLIVYHFMWRKEYGEGCVGCSFLSDHVDGANQHLARHDVSWVAVSRAPLADLEAFRRRMGWKFRWVSSQDSDFNFDYHVSFTPEEIASGKVYYNYRTVDALIEELSGISVFYKDEAGDIYHTYSSYARGNEEVLGAYIWLDLTPKGRNENGPYFSLTDWVRHHDRYEAGGHVDATGAYIAPDEKKPCCHG